MVTHSNDAFAPVMYLQILEAHLVPKDTHGTLPETLKRMLLKNELSNLPHQDASSEVNIVSLFV